MRFLPIFVILTACSPAIAQQYDGSRILQQLERADADGDGAVSRAEFKAQRQTTFARIDRNNDGVMTDSDIPARLKNRMPDNMSSDMLMKQFDKNGDGQVSEVEFVDGPAMVFDRVDANSDGKATRAEMETARAAFATR